MYMYQEKMYLHHGHSWICRGEILSSGCFYVLLRQRGLKMENDSLKSSLLSKLKEENHFWSYDVSKMDAISDESLIENVLLYLDIDDINKLFIIYPLKQVKRVWRDRVAPQGAMFRPINVLYAWYYFGAKRPEAYVKSLETRHINRMIAHA